jgi:hypothetical protein
MFVWSTGFFERILYAITSGFSAYLADPDQEPVVELELQPRLPAPPPAPLTLNTEMLRLIYDGQQATNRELQAVRAKLGEVETKMEVVQAELQTAKRRLEVKETEEQNKRQCEQYPFLKVRTRLTRRPTGVRATIYEIADQHNALQCSKEPIFHTEDNGTILNMNLYFPTVSDACRFMSDITELDWGGGNPVCELSALVCTQLYLALLLTCNDCIA